MGIKIIVKIMTSIRLTKEGVKKDEIQSPQSYTPIKEILEHQ